MKEQEALRRQRQRTEQALAAAQQALQQRDEQLRQTRQELEAHQRKLAEAQAIIADLKQQLFGSKAEKLKRRAGSATAQAGQRPPSAGPGSGAAEPGGGGGGAEQERDEQRQRKKNRRKRRHLPPVQLEKRTEVLEPQDKFCPTTGQPRPRIGQEVTTEYEFEPAKLIIKETVRPKYGECGKDCCSGVTVAPLPPRLLPQSKLGLGLAVFLLLSRFDDHIAYYTLERNFRERLGVVISRQQMVQWVEKIAFAPGDLLGIWEEL